VACEDESDPATWVKRLNDPAQKSAAVKRLSEFFEDAMTKAGLQDELLRLRDQTGTSFVFITHDIEEAIYLVSKITLVSGDDPALRPWRKRLFLLLARTSRSPVDSFHLPKHRIVTMGSYIEL